MKKKLFHSRKFQKEFYDKLGKEKVQEGGMLSCGYEERYNPRLLVDNSLAYHQLKAVYDSFYGHIQRGIMLDLCTGTGIQLPLLCTYAATLIGVDISIGLLERARELIREMNLENVALIQSGAETLPLQDNVCDAVALIDAIHHVENQEAVIREAWRVAKNNAPFLMMEPNISNPLVYLAHRIPKEERGALRINTAHGLQRLVRPYLKEVTVQPFNYVASKKNNPYAQAAFQIIELFFEKIFFFWPIRLLVQGKVSK